MSKPIAAFATPLGRSAMAVIRLSGQSSSQIIEEIVKYKKRIRKQKSNQILFNKIIKEDIIIDEVMISFFNSSSSYTGENSYEIYCHGNTLIANEILNLLILNGARLADPGEFTKTAFINRKLDLAQAEAVGDLIHSRSEQERKIACNHLEGELSTIVDKLRKDLIKIKSSLELSLDFSEEDIEFIGRYSLSREIDKIKDRISELLQTHTNRKNIRKGIRITLCGKTNVGKSSLFNYFLKEERAIVTHYHGTTRDYLEEEIFIDDHLVSIIDTAGIRETEEVIEQIGIQKSLDSIKDADVVLNIIDYNDYLSGNYTLEKGNFAINVVNKIDLANADILSGMDDFIFISVKDRINLENLKERIKEIISRIESKIDTHIAVNLRQKNILQDVLSELDEVSSAIKSDEFYEVIAFLINKAITQLGYITGEITSEEILNSIFNNFCIGK